MTVSWNRKCRKEIKESMVSSKNPLNHYFFLNEVFSIIGCYDEIGKDQKQKKDNSLPIDKTLFYCDGD